jgi:2-polyprenyl-3-methyl-5-hydroxy-6-metoxy-1,4-benzoquinol methylase
MSESWDDFAEDWDTNPSVIEYSNEAFDSLSEFINLQGLHVLDFGCGTGLLAEKVALKAASVVAIDTSKKMIEVLNNKKILNLDALVVDINEGSVADSPILNKGFDLVIASSVLAFVSDYDATLSKLASLLKPGGILIQWDWMQGDKEGSGFSYEAIKSAYLKLGFSIERIEEAFSISSENDVMSVIMGVARK